MSALTAPAARALLAAGWPARRALAYVRALQAWVRRRHLQEAREDCPCRWCDEARAEACTQDADRPAAKRAARAARRRRESALPRLARRGDW